MPKLVYVYEIPEAVRGDGTSVPKSVGFSPLSVDQEYTAARLGHREPLKQTIEGMKMSLVEVDGKPVDQGGEQLDVLLEKVGPGVRTLLIMAYNRIHGTTPEVEKSFFGSLKVKAT